MVKFALTHHPSLQNEPEGTIIITNSNLNSPANDVETNPGPNLDLATCMFTRCDEGSQKWDRLFTKLRVELSLS